MASHLEKDSSSTDSQLAKSTTKDTGSADGTPLQQCGGSCQLFTAA